MNIQIKFETDLIIRSFGYVAKQMAPSAQYEQILGEAEKHRSALRLLQRDVFEMTEAGWRKKTLTQAEFRRVRETAAKMIEQGQQAITRITAQYATHKLAA